MIQYENIDREDMARYWGAGYVFLPAGECWNAYQITGIQDDRILLSLARRTGTFGEPEENISMTHRAFFAQAMLHRPPLGVLIKDTGEVLALGWQHANGNELAKAIRPEDVYVAPVTEEPPATADAAPLEWVAECKKYLEDRRELLLNAEHDGLTLRELQAMPALHVMTEQLLARPELNVERPRVAGRGHNVRSISLILEFLNQKTCTIGEGLKKFTGKPVFLSGTAWLRAAGDRVALMNGARILGYVDAGTGQFSPQDSSTLLRLAGLRVYNSLT